MHLQENTLFDLDLGVVKVTKSVAQYHLHHVTYVPAKFGVSAFEDFGDAFIRKSII